MVSTIDFWSTDQKWDKKWVLDIQSFGECAARVKLELTDFRQSASIVYSVRLLNFLNSSQSVLDVYYILISLEL